MSALSLAPAGLVRAREYLRVSRDKSGRQRSTSEQHDEHVEIADEYGWELHPSPYLDLTSASRYASKERDGFAQLMRDLQGGTFDADILVMWETSRGSRRVGEWATMLDLLDDLDIKVYVHTHERILDPRNMHDWKTLMGEALDAEIESRKISRRTTRGAVGTAKRGLPSGICPVGYVRRYDPTTGQLVTQIADDSAEAIAEDPDRKPYAPMIRELFERIAAGHAIRAIARDFERDGWRSPERIVKKTGTPTGGKPYSPAHLRSLALTHSYAGLRVWVPGRRAGSSSATRIDSANIHDGNWDGLVSPELFYRVEHKLRDPKRVTTRPGRAAHLLSMIALCDECGDVLAGGKIKRSGPTYICHKGHHVCIDERLLDEAAELAILDYLGSSRVVADLSARESSGSELVKLRDTIASTRRELDELADSLGRGATSAELAGRAEQGIRKRLDAAVQRERELTTPAELRGLIEPGPGVEQRWAKMPLSARRQVARIVLRPDRLGELRIKRVGPVGPVRIPVDERIELRRTA